ncbi:2-dehydropantoate 2-reductase [Arthrobacter sp. MYb23]|uniref:ketopantoate reductase family protein n=1 Tax=unclassified Arthrobacter TaxID=235627 RepID=UPI000CFBB6FE|nr:MULTISPECIES: 2-dehydropantoate 2-reductase [unclassified Arthrobacter]PRB43096.1 2-dehydropantoate 2-reductase [Arthrobacter sp. MYb51]PRB98048.1 2-dehydropantoate 2-reductase [Arthrobacter sp. MYb23]
MKILIVGAGATGGAFGARLVDAGRDVTFLVRAKRAEVLAEYGLILDAPDGRKVHTVRTITTVEPGDIYDLVVLGLKAPALESALKTIRAAIGPNTVILPLLNGMGHFTTIEQLYPGRTIGGLAKIVATLGPGGVIHQMTPLAALTVGPMRGRPLNQDLIETLTVEGFTLSVDQNVLSRLWEKWVFIAAAGIVTCLFRGTIGNILAAGGRNQILQSIEETENVASKAGHTVSPESHRDTLALLTEEGSKFTSSLYRDLAQGDPVEAEHILGGLSAKAQAMDVSVPLLEATLLQLRTHRVARASNGQKPATDHQ